MRDLSNDRSLISINSMTSWRLFPNTAYTVCTATPASSAIARMLVAPYPFLAKSCCAASRIALRVAFACSSRFGET